MVDSLGGEQDLETIIYIHAGENKKAWDLNGFEIYLTDKVLAEIKKSAESGRLIKGGNRDVWNNVADWVLGETCEVTAYIQKNENAAKSYSVYLTTENSPRPGIKIGSLNCYKNKRPKLWLVKIPKMLGIMPLGIGNGFSVDYDNTCFILNADKQYLIDCPEDLRTLIKPTINLEEKINDVILTHNDPDHVGALRKLVQKKAFRYKTKINIYTTKKIFEDFMYGFQGLQKELGSAINFIGLDTITIMPFTSDKGLRVEIRDNIHGDVPTIGLKFSYKYKTLGYSSDCKYDKQLLLNQGNFYKEMLQHIKNWEDKTNTDADFVRCHDLNNLLLLVTGRPFNGFVTSENEIIKSLLKEGVLSLENFYEDGGPIKTTERLSDVKTSLQRVVEKYTRVNVAWFSNCNLIIHEATNNPSDPVHTYIGELEKLPKEIKSKMFLAHVPDQSVFKRKGGSYDSKIITYSTFCSEQIKPRFGYDYFNTLSAEKQRKQLNDVWVMVPNMKYLVI